MKIKTIVKNVGMELETKENRKYEDILINVKDIIYVCERKRKVVNNTEEIIGTVKLKDGRLLLTDLEDKRKLYEDIKYIQFSLFTINLRFIYINDIVNNYNYIVGCDMVESISEVKYSENLSENISEIKLSNNGPVTSIKVTSGEKEKVMKQMHKIYSCTDEDKTFNIHDLAHSVSEILRYMGKAISYVHNNKLKLSEIDLFKNIYALSNTLIYHGAGKGDFNEVSLSIISDFEKSAMEFNSRVPQKYTDNIDFECINSLFEAIRNDEYNIGDLRTLIDIPFATTAVNKVLKVLIEMKFYANRYRNDINDGNSNDAENSNTLIVNKGIREFNDIIKSQDIFRYTDLLQRANTYSVYNRLYKYDIVLNRNTNN